MTRVLVEIIDVCGVCGEVAPECDLWWVEDEDDEEDYGVPVGGVVCEECV